MGTIVELRKLKSNQNVFRLLIYSKAPPDLLSNAFSINKLLAAELVKLKPSRRTMQLENCFVKLLERFPNQSVIKDIDIMFNPEYKVDVMKLLVSAYKRKPFSLIWPGRYSENRLIYSEEGYPDYKSYGIEGYDILCVI